MKWKTLTEERIPDIIQFVADHTREGQSLHIGTDSLQTGRFTQFVTIVAILTPHKGGRVAYAREVVPRISSMRERLLKEVLKSVNLGLELSEVAKGELTVSVDANPVLQHKSSKYIQELTALVVSQGFKILVKPDAFAASHVADHVVRTLGKLPVGA